MKEQELYAYLAGLFDGEGTVSLGRRNSTDKFRHPTLSMTSTTPDLLEICRLTFGGKIRKQKRYKPHHKPAQVWTCRYDSAIIAIEKMLPFIREPSKRDRMQFILSNYKLVTPRNGKYSETALQEKLQFEYDFFHPSNSMSN